VLIRQVSRLVILISLVLLITVGCRNTNLPWRSGQLVAQLYRQANQELLLTYNDMSNDLLIEQQYGYARAYFDNYRKQIIFSGQGTLDYLFGGEQFTTATESLSGYVFELLFNETYQIGVEIIDIKDGSLGQGQFWGTKSRIIDLQNKSNVIVEGLFFNRNMIAGHYFYGFTFNEDEDQLLEIIDLRTMDHRRINMKKNKITFLYQNGDQVYGQSEAEKTTFVFDGLDMQETKDKYDSKLSFSTDPWYILKNIAPTHSSEHWYVEAGKYGTQFNQVRFIQIKGNGEIDEKSLKLQRDDVSQILDVSNYGDKHIAVYYEAKDVKSEQWYTFITVYDLDGNKVANTEIESVRNGHGRFLYLDYLE